MPAYITGGGIMDKYDYTKASDLVKWASEEYTKPNIYKNGGIGRYNPDGTRQFDCCGYFKCFMLDKPSTQGFSGGPAISFDSNESQICYGIIHGTRQDNTGGKLAIVVHSAYLFELLNYAKSAHN